MTEANVRIGLLGASGIAPNAVLKPALDIEGVEVTAVAARDVGRAEQFAALHNIPTVHDNYEALVADESLDAIYNALVPSMHAEWSIKALERGKHVLCEKPFACNATEAAEMVRVARDLDRVLMEAFHWRYHPLARAMLEVVGRISPLVRGEAAFGFHLDDKDRWLFQYDLGGGATMDAGCYPIHWMRTLAGEEPEVVRASAVVENQVLDRRAGRARRTDLVPRSRRYRRCAPGTEPPRSTTGAPPYCAISKWRSARRDLRSSANLCVPTGGVPRRRTRWWPAADRGGRRHREHGHHRQHLPSSWAAAALRAASRSRPSRFSIIHRRRGNSATRRRAVP
jgi:predicted dehydrogenase